MFVAKCDVQLMHMYACMKVSYVRVRKYIVWRVVVRVCEVGKMPNDRNEKEWKKQREREKEKVIWMCLCSSGKRETKYEMMIRIAAFFACIRSFG